MDAELEAMAEALGRGIAEGAPDLNELLTEALNGSVEARTSARRLSQVFARHHGNPWAGRLAAGDLLKVLRVTRYEDAIVYEKLKAIADTLAEDERARTAPPPQHAPDATTNSNTISGGTFNEPVVQAGIFNGGVHTYYGQPSHSGVPPVADSQLDRANAIALGVRRPRRIADERPLPRYVARDCDPALDAQVRAAAREGGLVLVTGEPLSGKTRTLWAALFTNLSGTTRILHPAPGTDLRGLTAVLRARGDAECVLWLDDLDGHLGEHGLTAALLAELARLRVPVLATMSDEAYDAHRFGSPAHARLLSGVDPVELGAEWSPAEVERLASATPGDLRLAGAYAHRARHSTTEYLAVGPELLGEWRRARRANAHPLGHHLVLAAIDLARCGVEEAVPADVLRRADALYRGAAPVASSEEFDEALEWASRIRHGTTGMLVPGAEAGSWRAYGSLVEDARDGVPGFGQVPLKLWPLAVEAVRCDDDRAPLDAVLARARAVLGPKADESEAAGSLGKLLFHGEDMAAAIRYLEKAAEIGDVEAQRLLGIALKRRSEHWLRTAAENGDGDASVALGDLHRGEGDLHAALPWYRAAAEQGLRTRVAARIGWVFHVWEDHGEAEKWYRIGVAAGDLEVANDLGLKLESRGAMKEAALLYQRSAEGGSSTGAHNFGIVLENRGEPKEARAWFARAHDLGDYAGAFLLGRSLMREKRYDEAEEWFRKAQDMGHHDAGRELTDLRAERGDGRSADTPDNVKA
ncbi:SEL1-like repeat protein [Streptomyces anulatus]|uniref:SEL1-like repeat protein n=1 Tax=Streptomyces anulatus TaxID=1892 RepID=UPI00368F5230